MADRRYGVNGGLAIKAPCRACSTSNITLSGEQTIDGIAVVDGDRVLVTGQTDGSENGIYEASTGAWSRTKDWDGNYDVVTGTCTFVHSGTSNSGWYYVQTTGTITIGTTSVTIAAASSSLAVFTAFIQTLFNDADEAAARATLGALGTDLTLLTAETAVEAADILPLGDLSAGTTDKVTLANLFKVITLLTAETSPAIDDELAIYDLSATSTDKITLANLLKVVTGLTAETAPATDDELLLYDLSASTADKITLANLLKVVNSLTEDTAADSTADYLLTYDASAAAVKKALINKVSGLAFIAEATASASSSVNFTGLSSDYDDYILMLEDVYCASSPVALNMRYSTDGGSTYKSGASDYLSDGDTAVGGSAQMALTPSSDWSTTQRASGIVSLFGMNSTTTTRHAMTANLSCFPTGVGITQKTLSGRSNANMAAAINAIRILAGGGNITAGTFRLYGVKKQ